MLRCQRLTNVGTLIPATARQALFRGLFSDPNMVIFYHSYSMHQRLAKVKHGLNNPPLAGAHQRCCGVARHKGYNDYET